MTPIFKVLCESSELPMSAANHIILFGNQIMKFGNRAWLPTGYPVTKFARESCSITGHSLFSLFDKNAQNRTAQKYRMEVKNNKAV